MPSNPYIEEMKACKYIDRALTKQLKEMEEGLHINELILQVKLLFPVSKNFIKQWVKDMYIDSGLVGYDTETLILTYKEV